jgi:hypothetical protein
MTNQEVYTTVRRHLLTQMARSEVIGYKGYNKRCMYRGPNGRKCAVGCLIPDARYKEDLEDHTTRSLDVQEAAGLTHEQAIGLAFDLQTVHDFKDPNEWRERLDSVAKKYNLQIEE